MKIKGEGWGNFQDIYFVSLFYFKYVLYIIWKLDTYAQLQNIYTQSNTLSAFDSVKKKFCSHFVNNIFLKESKYIFVKIKYFSCISYLIHLNFKLILEGNANEKIIRLRSFSPEMLHSRLVCSKNSFSFNMVFFVFKKQQQNMTEYIP